MSDELPTGSIEISVLEGGYLMSFIFQKLMKDPGDPIAGKLFDKLRANAVALGVKWVYGDPRDPRDQEESDEETREEGR